MGCWYWVDGVQFRSSDRPKVEALLAERDLTDRFEFSVDEENGVSSVYLSEADMSNSTACDVDDFLDDMAELVKGTEHDGQLVDYDYDNESKGVHVLVDGRRLEAPAANLVSPTPEQVPLGGVQMVSMKVAVLGLPNRRGLIVGV